MSNAISFAPPAVDAAAPASLPAGKALEPSASFVIAVKSPKLAPVTVSSSRPSLLFKSPPRSPTLEAAAGGMRKSVSGPLENVRLSPTDQLYGPEILEALHGAASGEKLGQLIDIADRAPDRADLAAGMFKTLIGAIDLLPAQDRPVAIFAVLARTQRRASDAPAKLEPAQHDDIRAAAKAAFRDLPAEAFTPGAAPSGKARDAFWDEVVQPLSSCRTHEEIARQIAGFEEAGDDVPACFAPLILSAAFARAAALEFKYNRNLAHPGLQQVLQAVDFFRAVGAEAGLGLANRAGIAGTSDQVSDLAQRKLLKVCDGAGEVEHLDQLLEDAGDLLGDRAMPVLTRAMDARTAGGPQKQRDRLNSLLVAADRIRDPASRMALADRILAQVVDKQLLVPMNAGLSNSLCFRSDYRGYAGKVLALTGLQMAASFAEIGRKTSLTKAEFKTACAEIGALKSTIPPQFKTDWEKALLGQVESSHSLTFRQKVALCHQFIAPDLLRQGE